MGIQIWRAQNLKANFYGQVFKPIEGKDVYSVVPALLRPGSRGCIKLRSKNVYDYPIIDPNYFDDPQDMATLVEGVKIALKVTKTESLQR